MNFQVAFLWASITGQLLCGYQLVHGLDIQRLRSGHVQHEGMHAKAVMQNSTASALLQPPQEKQSYTGLTSLWARTKQLLFKEEQPSCCQRNLPCCRGSSSVPAVSYAPPLHGYSYGGGSYDEPAPPMTGWSRGSVATTAGYAAFPAMMTCLGFCTLCVIICVFFSFVVSVFAGDDIAYAFGKPVMHAMTTTVAAPPPRPPPMPPPQPQVRESIAVAQPYMVGQTQTRMAELPQTTERVRVGTPRVVGQSMRMLSSEVVAKAPQIVEKVVERPPQVVERPPQVIEKIVERPPQIIEKVVEVPQVVAKAAAVETVQPTVVTTTTLTTLPSVVTNVTAYPPVAAVSGSRAAEIEYVVIGGQQVAFYEIIHLQSLTPVQLREHAVKLNGLFGVKIDRPLPTNDAHLIEWILFVQNTHVAPLRRVGGAAASVTMPASFSASATVGVDVNHNGRPDFLYTGMDRNRDGIPDALQRR